MPFRVGDAVVVVDQDKEGTITHIKGSAAVVELSHGFSELFSYDEITHSHNFLHDVSIIPKDEIKIVEKPSAKPQRLTRARHPLRLYHSHAYSHPTLDLHIETLRPSDHHHLSNVEILAFQMARAKQFVEDAIEAHQAHIIFIHGKGEGVLKTNLLGLLYKNWGELLKNKPNIITELDDATLMLNVSMLQ